MSDLWAVALATAAFAGGLATVDGHLRPVPLVLAAGLTAVALAARRPALLCLGVALLTAALAERSLAGLAPPPAGPVRAEVTLVTDPVPDGRGGVHVGVRLDGRRLRARARTAAAAALDDRLAGERVLVLGALEPPGPAEERLRHRHLAGRLRVDTVVGWRPGGTVTRAANELRRTLARGAEVLPERQRSLLAGLTLGDDRDQPADLADAFQRAGLTHLLAVSGSNVAFVLVIFAPLLVRLRFAPRLAATLGVLAGFALVTRFEPSVLRATAMAAVAATGAALGRPASALRTLGLGVTGILLVDPLLATALGFQLSVAGTAGIVVGARPLQRALPGPGWCTAPLSVTAAAQLAVAPLLVAAFDSVPVASLPANLLAAPAAGPVMVWGLTGGLVAGLAGDPVATVAHLPTRPLLAWIEGVALITSRWPLGDVDASGLAPLTVGALSVAAGRVLGPRRRRVSAGLQALGGLVVVAVLAGSAWPSAPGDLDEVEIAIGATAWRAGGAAVLAIDGRAVDGYVLSGLRREGVRRVDVVVLRTDARTARETATTLRRRWPTTAVLAPDGATPPDIEGAVSPPIGTTVDVGGLRVAVTGNSGGRLDVRVEQRPAPTAR